MEFLRLKELLKEKGMSGKTLAEKIGITETSLSRIIKGKQQPGFELLLQISNELGVDIRDLFNSTKNSNFRTIYLKKDNSFIPIGQIKNFDFEKGID